MNAVTTQIISLITTAVSFGTVIMYGSLGEILTEKSGHLNLGVPGIMYLGGIGGLVGAFLYESAAAQPSPMIGLLIALGSTLVCSVLGGLIYSFLTITLRANQNVTGLTLTIFGSGVANFVGGSLNKLAGGVGQISVAATSSAFRATQHLTDRIPYFDDVFCNYGFMVYLALAIAIVLSIFLNRTSIGLNLRAVGESPATADAAGVRVTRYKYLSTCIGAAVSGLGGLYYVMDYIKGTWANDGNIEAVGWLAVALVIFATWKPLRAVWGAYLFGALYWLYNFIPGLSRSSQQIFKMLPYVVTILVLILVSLLRKRENHPPASLGLSYFREDR
ncbi:MAG: ABC transporter permease [Clostridia bacterium]|nr:ABC transporter permease [Clostridia bacterium]